MDDVRPDARQALLITRVLRNAVELGRGQLLDLKQLLSEEERAATGPELLRALQRARVVFFLAMDQLAAQLGVEVVVSTFNLEVNNPSTYQVGINADKPGPVGPPYGQA